MGAATTSVRDERAARLDVVLEDAGGRSVLHSLVTTLASQHGTRSHRFAARLAGDVDAAPVATSPTFPVPALSMIRGHEAPEDGWPEDAQRALDELEVALVADGWERTGVGDDWWARRYTREQSSSSGS